MEFGAVGDGQRARAEQRDLAAQLRADRAAGAGGQHDAIVDQARDALEVGADLRAAEQIAEIDRLRLDAAVAADLRRVGGAGQPRGLKPDARRRIRRYRRAAGATARNRRR